MPHKNKEAAAARKKLYREENKEAIATRKKLHYEENKEAYAAKSKIYRADFIQSLNSLKLSRKN